MNHLNTPLNLSADRTSEILWNRPANDISLHLPVLRDALDAQRRLSPHGVLIRTRWNELPGVLPADTAAHGLVWVIALPDDVDEELEGLACSPIEVVNQTSVDLLHCVTFIEWHTPRRSLSVAHTGLAGDTSADASSLLIFFLTSKRVILVRTLLTEDFEGALQGAHISSGINYNPYRVWSEDELAEAAAHASAIDRSGPRLLGTPGLVWLHSCIYDETDTSPSSMESLQELLRAQAPVREADRPSPDPTAPTRGAGARQTST